MVIGKLMEWAPAVRGQFPAMAAHESPVGRGKEPVSPSWVMVTEVGRAVTDPEVLIPMTTVKDSPSARPHGHVLHWGMVTLEKAGHPAQFSTGMLIAEAAATKAATSTNLNMAGDGQEWKFTNELNNWGFANDFYRAVIKVRVRFLIEIRGNDLLGRSVIVWKISLVHR